MNALIHRRIRRAAAFAALCLATSAVPSALWAGHSWIPLGPDLINDGQAWPGRTPVTGRINVVAPNPENPLGDVWIGSAGGGVWHGSVHPDNYWFPMTDDQESLAVGSIALDNCTKARCATVWVGTGEDSIRRDTQYGAGILKGQWNSTTSTYDWTLLGKNKFARGAITKIVLDPATSGADKVVFAALSTGQTSNGSHSTVTTHPSGILGIWRSSDDGQTWNNVLSQKTPATDLEMDPQDHKILFAGLQHRGLFRSVDGGNTWQAIGKGIPEADLAAADWPEIAVYRKPWMDAAILYAVLGSCPHPHTKSGSFWCSPAVYFSDDGGDNWFLAHAEFNPPPAYGDPLTSYATYTHALAIHPNEPFTLFFGGINLYKSTSVGLGWTKVGNWALHPDHHQVVVFESKWTDTGIIVYDVNDGGFFVGDGDDQWTGQFQQGLAVTQALSVSRALTLKKSLLLAGTQDNGTNVYHPSFVWDHVDDGDSSSTLIDADDIGKTYDVYVGQTPRRCTNGNTLCAFNWPYITTGLTDGDNVSWYPPLAQDPTGKGQHPLYMSTVRLYRSVDDGDHWTPVSGALGGAQTIPELAGIQNPISAVAVAPGNPDRIYVGYYGGQVFTTTDGQSANPTWTAISSGLPGRPVTSIAVHPKDDQTVFVAFAGLSTHSVYRSTTGGASWGPLDDSLLGDFAAGSVNALAIEPDSPFAVWAGTDTGVYKRDDADSAVSLWYKSSKGLPNVAVYDLELASGGGVLYAATHGRGVWRLSVGKGFFDFPEFYEEACCGYFDPYVSAPFISMSVDGFDPLQRCSVNLYEGSRLCSSSATDADGATLSTDAYGFLVSAKEGYYTDRKVSWACHGGTCAGGVPASRCEVSEIEVTCGERTVRSRVQTAEETSEPASTRLGFAPTGLEGSFTLTPMLKKTGGLSEPLCSVDVRYRGDEDDEKVLARAVDAVNADERCRRAGVTAALSGSASPGGAEDEGPVPFRLALSAPEQTGVELVTGVTGTGAAALTVDAFGTRQGSRVVPRLTFSGRAVGGRVEVTERSPLGTCTFAVDTAAGDTPETVAAAVQRAFLGRPDPSVFQIGGGCPERQNARDAFLNGASVHFALGQQIAVTSTDPGLSFTVGSDL